MSRSTAVESDRAARARIRQLDMRRFAEKWRGREAELIHSSRHYLIPVSRSRRHLIVNSNK
jgi:hypothetical protein